MSDRFNSCATCDGPIDPYGRDGTRCARCKEDCQVCGGDVAYCSHPLPRLAVEPFAELKRTGTGGWL